MIYRTPVLLLHRMAAAPLNGGLHGVRMQVSLNLISIPHELSVHRYVAVYIDLDIHPCVLLHLKPLHYHIQHTLLNQSINQSNSS